MQFSRFLVVFGVGRGLVWAGEWSNTLKLRIKLKSNTKIEPLEPLLPSLLPTCKGSFGGCQGQPLARPWHLLIDPSGLQPFPPHRFVSLQGYCLITTSSSSIDSPVTHARLACSLSYTWASMPHTTLFKPPYTRRALSTIFKYYTR
jgi:hypothetical protein